jgi:HAD superfamily hydrolase (TIGR01549 family)
MKAAIFDMDGTLMDTWPAIYGCINEVLASMGAEPYEAAVLKPLVGTFIGDIYKNRGVDPDEARKIHKALYLSKYASASNPYPGSVETLARLKSRGLKNAVITMRIGEVARKILGDYGYGVNLDIVLGEDEVARGKPDPEHVMAACRAMEVAPEDAVMVGDTEFDMLAGMRAGCRSIGVSWGYGQPDKAGVVKIVDSFDELEREILRE